jgi:ribosomal protein S6--L-glutamate ligase
MVKKSKISNRRENPAGSVLSMHPVIEGDTFYWDRGIWDQDLVEEIRNARAVILPQTVQREMYGLCKRLCPNVFPNYDLRFQWEGKVGDSLLFWTYGVPHPQTFVYPRVETLLGDHPFMDHSFPGLPQFPFVLKGAQGGEGKQIWLIENEDQLKERIDHLKKLELQGSFGFVIQQFFVNLQRDLRVVIIGDQVSSYWRKSEGFRHNLAQGGEIDAESDPDLQASGRDAVLKLSKRTGINLAAFDLVFPTGSREPFFLEINYTFGRSGLGGTAGFQKCLRLAVDKWLQETRVDNDTKAKEELQYIWWRT